MDLAPSDDPAQLDGQAVLRMLGSDALRGLSAAEAARRLMRDGPNALQSAPPVPAWQRLLAQFRDPLVYLLLVAAAVTLGAWWAEGAAGWPTDAVVIVAVVAVNALIGFVQESRSQGAARALQQLTAAHSTVLRDGQAVSLPSEELVRGDVLLLAEGDAVGADARLLEASGLLVQEASLTGESAPVLKDPAALPGPAALGDQACMVFKGTAVAEGSGKAVVTATGMATQMGAIAGLLARTEQDLTPLQREVGRAGRLLGLAVVGIAAVVVAAVLLTSPVRSLADLLAVLLLGVSLAVAAVPEGLPAILSLVLALGVQRMARQQAIVKKLSSVETLGSATVICTDKTGTLTRSEMTIERVVTASGSSCVTGVGYAPHGEVRHADQPLECGPVHAEHVVVLGGGSLAGHAGLQQQASGEWSILGDPTEAAFLVAERKLGTHERRSRRFERIGEVPFSSDRKMMSIIARDAEQAHRLVLISKGAPDVLLARCNRVRVGDDVRPLDPAQRQRILAEVDALSDAALRTLAVAYRPLDEAEDAGHGAALERDLVFVGTVGMIDPPRPEAAAAIREARAAGIRVVMITGDHPRTAARIAADLGLADPGATVLTGAQLDTLDDAALRRAVRDTAVYARVAPAHKLRIVDALQAEGEVVAMTGDGVNDAPALKSADIGIAMGRTGTEVSKQAARMILADDNFATLVAAVREGRGIVANLRKVLRYLLSSNIGEVLTVFLAVVGARLMGLQQADGSVALPLLATQILWINLVTDAAPALALGADPQTEDLMRHPPRRAGQRLLDARTWREVLATGTVMAGATLATLELLLPGGLWPGRQSVETARTAAFTVLVLAQLFNCFNARSELRSAWHGMLANRWLWAAVLAGVALQIAVVHLPLLQAAFGTTPLSAGQWLLCTVMAASVLVWGELTKAVRRRMRARA